MSFLLAHVFFCFLKPLNRKSEICIAKQRLAYEFSSKTRVLEEKIHERSGNFTNGTEIS